MQVGIDVMCMHTNFGGHALPGFGDIATFKTAKFPFLSMDYSPWSSKKFNRSESAQNIHASREYSNGLGISRDHSHNLARAP